MKIIHDTIWGDIEVDDRALHIIDSLCFQRLHSIRQLGFCYRVFPGASHSRFSHSLGCYFLAKRWIHHFQQQQGSFFSNHSHQHMIIDLLPLVALCHDIGHGPFSHWFDTILSTIAKSREGLSDSSLLWCSHEQRGWYWFQHCGFFSIVELSIIQEMLFGPQTQWYHQLIFNSRSFLDIDKMDYLLRDLHHLGIQKKIDVSRIIAYSRICVHPSQNTSEITYSLRVSRDIEDLAHLRHYMYSEVYHHPTTRRFESELWSHIQQKQQFFLDFLSSPSWDQFCLWTDDSFLMFLLHPPSSVWNSWHCRQWTQPKPSLLDSQKSSFDPHSITLPTFISSSFFFSQKEI